MNFKHYALLAVTAFTLLACSNVPEEDFYLIQNGETFSENEVSLTREPFTIVSKHKEYAFVMAKKPIRMLADHKDIVKLVATGAAWEKGDALLYEDSDLLSDKDACYAYFGNTGAGCEEYVKQKVILGFRKHYAYTFAAYYPNEKKWEVQKIDEVEIQKTKAPFYYLYLFKDTDKIGDVAVAQHVTRIKINIK